MKVYTGAGDDGTTGLFYGGRVPKDAEGPDAYGTVDEAVAALGLARVEAGTEMGALILRLQKELFVVGAELATAPQNRSKLVDDATRVTQGMCEGLGAEIDRLEARLPELTEFVIPGGSRLSAGLDHARTVVRRAERRCVSLGRSGALDNPHLLTYMNRLGDLVFLLARDAEDERETLHGR